ncbi:MAG: nuclear transport factor 2 family protein, partial [Flavobacteriaceae bacterium]|nr:nuclear transport factor 2 family protein [Flavobacteriaceae bacterium]
MKKLVLLLFVVVICSCQSPNGTVTTNDERSEIIKTLFKNVSEENIDYLKEVFSDDMTFVDARNNTKDKAGFIAGVEGLFEMFDEISFEDVDGDATGSEIETTVYDNGIVWTNIWNTFSATGKYTGQKVSFPFHIAYKWDGLKISREVQFFDNAVFDKELNAMQAANNISEKLVILLELKVTKGNTKKDVQTLVKKLNDFVRANEPNTYDYTYFISENGKRVFLVEKYLTSADMVLHANNFEGGPNFAPFMKMFEIDKF